VSKSLIRKYVLLSLLLVTPTGFLFKFYSGPAQWWFNDYGAGIPYVIFWVLVIFLLFPYEQAANRIPLWVFSLTSTLEVIQLWHPVILEKVRSHFLGRTLIGTSFTWWDFPHYAVGGIVGWVWIRRIMRRGR
jgi:hypothetical protein